MRDIALILCGVVAILLAGYGATAYLNKHARRADFDSASRAARRAMELAEASRDACPATVNTAEVLLQRARGLMARATSAATARKAQQMAERADQMWLLATRTKRDEQDSKAAAESATEEPESPHSGRYAAAIAADPLASSSSSPGSKANALKIGAIVLLVLVGVTFIGIQTKQPDTVYKPRDTDSAATGDDAEPPPPPQPTYSQILDEYGDDPIITMDGSPANLQEDVVLEWMEIADVDQVVLAPQLPSSAELDDAIDVPDDVLLVTGLQPSLSPYNALPSTFPDMQLLYGTGDVTSGVVYLLALRADRESEAPDFDIERRVPTEAELAPVLAALQDSDIAFVDDAEKFDYPQQAFSAYPEGEPPLIVVAPQAPAGEPLVDYASAVSEAIPDRPVVGLTGTWVDFAGPYADEFADPMRASLYGQYGYRIQQFDYTDATTLRLALGRVEDYRFSGIFGRPLPYEPIDPLELALPFLPWLCAGLGAVAIVAAIAQVRRQRPTADPVTDRELSRLAGLSELSVEISGLTEGRNRSALVRATRALAEAKDACDADEEVTVVRQLLDRAEGELTRIADALERPDYRPRTFLEGRWT